MLHATLIPLALGLVQAATPAPAAAPSTQEVPAWTTLRWGELDGDGRADVLVLDARAPLRLLRNRGDGGFDDVTARCGLAELVGAQDALWQDVDGDGRGDLLLVVPAGASRLLRNVDGASFEDAAAHAGLPLDEGLRHARFLDYDGDGLADLQLATARRERLFRGLGRCAFEEVALALGPPRGDGGPPAAPLTPPLGPAGPPVGDAAQVPPGTQVAGVPDCPPTVADWASPGSCLAASSVPTLGLLWPLSADLNVQPGTGNVGVGTSAPGRKLDVVGGDVRTTGAFVSTTTGAPPLQVSSTQLVQSLNADRLDGLSSEDFSQLGTTIGTLELEDRSVSRAKLADFAVGPGQLESGSVYTNHLIDLGVATTKLADGAVTAAKLGASSVASSHIANGAIVDADVSSSAAIHGGKVVPHFGFQDVSALGSAGFGTLSPIGDLDVKDPGDAASLQVYTSTSNGTSEVFFGENSGGSLGVKLRYDGALTNQLQVLQRLNGSDATSPWLAIERDTGRTSIGTAGTQDAMLTVQARDTSLEPAIQAYGGSESALNAESDAASVTIRGENTGTGVGVEGTSPGTGVWGYTDSSSGVGVYGQADLASGYSDGVWARSEHPGAYATYTRNVATTGNAIGIYASSSSPDGRGVYGTVVAGGSGYAVYASGDFGCSGTKSFVQPHPTDPSKQVNFVCLEGNESGTYFRGSTRLVAGVAVIEVPEEFGLVTQEEGLTVQLTPKGPRAGLWLESVGLGSIVVRGERDVELDYFVNGVRRGFADLETVRPNTCFRPADAGVPYGEDLDPQVRELLVENGILNPDYTPDEATAAALGWTLRRGEETRRAQEQRLEARQAAGRAEAAALRERRAALRSRQATRD